MLLNEFPDLAWLKNQISSQFAGGSGWGGRVLTEPGWPTVILNTKVSNVRRDNIAGPLSLFTNHNGSSYVSVDGHRAKVNPGFFFVTNPGQRYSLEIEKTATGAKTETFNIHFGERFAEEALSSLTKQPEFLLENHFRKNGVDSVNFYNRLYPMDPLAVQLIQSIPTESLGEEERLFNLVRHLLGQLGQLDKSKQRIPALKAATRQEIIRRLYISTDYIYTFFDKDLTLEELARVSCLSKFHYLRLFRMAFGETPHQFITKVRMERAKELLRNGRLEVVTISRLVGFENPSSFSRLFRNQTGLYPTQFRQ